MSNVTLDKFERDKSNIMKYFKITKTEEKYGNSQRFLNAASHRRSRSSNRGPFISRETVRRPLRDRSAESHLLYRAYATDKRCMAAQVYESSLK